MPKHFIYRPIVGGPYEPEPLEFIQGTGWVRGNVRVHGVKPRYAFIWPKDGRRDSKGGRLKDILQGRGPDVFISIKGEKGPWKGPTRARWSRWADLSTIDYDDALTPPWWARRYGRYDFRTRRYKQPDAHTWSDARWREGARDKFPLAYRCRHGGWYQLWEVPLGQPHGLVDELD